MLLTCDTLHPFIVSFLFCSIYVSVRTLNFCLNVKFSSILSALGVKSNHYPCPLLYNLLKYEPHIIQLIM